MSEIVFNCPECGVEVRTRYKNRKFCKECAKRRCVESNRRADAKRKERRRAERQTTEPVHKEEIYFHDSPEDIQKCLNCTKPRCNDCLH